MEMNAMGYSSCLLSYKIRSTTFFLTFKMGHPLPLFPIFSVLFEHTIQFIRQINLKNINLVSIAGVKTHILCNTSLLSQPLDQTSRYVRFLFAGISLRRALSCL